MYDDDEQDGGPRTPDALIAAERALAAGIVGYPDLRDELLAGVRAEDLSTPQRQIVEAAAVLHAAGEDVTILSVLNQMTQAGTLSRAGGAGVVGQAMVYSGEPRYALGVVARHVRLRRLAAIGIRARQVAEEPGTDPHALAVNVATAAQAIVDGIESSGKITTPNLGEFLSVEDDPYDWVIPGMLEHGDRLILTGEEGLGKSVLCRQIAVCAASGVHPFSHKPIPAKRVLFVDCENSPQKLRRALRALRIAAKQNGSDPDPNMWIEAIPAGLDLTNPEDEVWLTQRVASLQPDLLVIGPIYRLHAGNPNDEEPARQLTRVLDRCRAAANCAVMTEAHTSHANGSAERPLRPTGSSLWLRWPEFGYGIRKTDEFSSGGRMVTFSSWRGDREERHWPARLRSGTLWPWEDDNPEHEPTRTEQALRAAQGIDNDGERDYYP